MWYNDKNSFKVFFGVIMNLKKIDKMYNNKDVMNSKKELERKNEIMINRLMILFILSVTMITLLIIAMNISAVDYVDLYQKYALASVIVTGALAFLSAVFFFYETAKRNSSDKTLNKYNVLGLFLILFIYALAIFIKGILAVPTLLAFTIAATLLIFIYYLYQKDFFWFSALSAVGCFVIYFTKSTFLRGYFAIGLKGLLIAAGAVLIWKALSVKNSGGYWDKKKNIRIFSENAKYLPVIILCGLLACAGILAFVQPSLIFYAIIAVLAYFLVIGIYYTIKLI